VPPFIASLLEEGTLYTKDSHLVIPYELSLSRSRLTRVLEKLHFLLLCPGVEVCPLLVDFLPFRLSINDVLTTYHGANVFMILSHIFAHVNNLSWLSLYVAPY